MHGTIIFDNVTELAKFLREFTGSTAVFEVRYSYEDAEYKLTFTGGC